MADEKEKHPDSGAVVDHSWEKLVAWTVALYADLNDRLAQNYMARWYQAERNWTEQHFKVATLPPAEVHHVVPDRPNGQINIVEGPELVMPKLLDPWDIPPPPKPAAGTVDVGLIVFPDGSLYRMGPLDTTWPGDTTLIGGVVFTHITGGPFGAKYWAAARHLNLFGG